jgi:hypothetical protein
MATSLPYSHEAEWAVLGSLLLNNHCYKDIASIITASDFDNVLNRKTFEAIETLLSNNNAVDAILLTEHFKDDASFGRTHFFDLMRLTVSVNNVILYAEIIRDKSLLRQLYDAAKIAENTTLEAHTSPQQVITNLSNTLDAIQARLSVRDDEWLIDAKECLTEPSPQHWLVKHWLPQRSLCMLEAKPGAGKSFLALDWALRIATGTPFWLTHPVKKGIVVYLAGEGHYGLRRRVKAWCQHNKKEPENLYLSKSGCHLDTEEGYQKVLSTIKKKSIIPSLIIVDTLHRFLAGHVNDSQDAGKMITACDKLKQEFDATILLIHHVGHNSDHKHRGVGSIFWGASLDIDMNLEKIDDKLKLTQPKPKDCQEAIPLLLELKQITIGDWFDDENEPVTSAIIVQAEPTVEQKEDSVMLINHQKMFVLAWEFSGGNINNDQKPYISYRDFHDFLVNERGFSPKSAQQSLKNSDLKRTVGFLLVNKMVTIFGDGWAISNQQWLNNILK